jgi:hypothetical protein
VKKNQPGPVQRQFHLVLDQEPERTPEATTKGLAALADCKRKVDKTPAPVARVRSNGSSTTRAHSAPTPKTPDAVVTTVGGHSPNWDHPYPAYFAIMALSAGTEQSCAARRHLHAIDWHEAKVVVIANWRLLRMRVLLHGREQLANPAIQRENSCAFPLL